jgi:hypothetical protein
MFFNNAVANLSQASTGPVGPFNYDPMSDSDLGASSACFGITPLPDGGWSADSPLIVGSRLYYTSALTAEVSGSSGNPYWYSWMDPADSTEYVYRYESDLGGIVDVGICSNPSFAVNWSFIVNAGATGSLKIFKNTVEIVNTSVTANPGGTFYATILDDIKSEVSCSVASDKAVSILQVGNPFGTFYDACDNLSSNTSTITNFGDDGFIAAEIDNQIACP